MKKFIFGTSIFFMAECSAVKNPGSNEKLLEKDRKEQEEERNREQEQQRKQEERKRKKQEEQKSLKKEQEQQRNREQEQQRKQEEERNREQEQQRKEEELKRNEEERKRETELLEIINTKLWFFKELFHMPLGKKPLVSLTNNEFEKSKKILHYLYYVILNNENIKKIVPLFTSKRPMDKVVDFLFNNDSSAIKDKIQELEVKEDIKNDMSESLLSAVFYYFEYNIDDIYKTIFECSSEEEDDIAAHTVLFRDCVYLAFKNQLLTTCIPDFFNDARQQLSDKNGNKTLYIYNGENSHVKALTNTIFKNFEEKYTAQIVLKKLKETKKKHAPIASLLETLNLNFFLSETFINMLIEETDENFSMFKLIMYYISSVILKRNDSSIVAIFEEKQEMQSLLNSIKILKFISPISLTFIDPKNAYHYTCSCKAYYDKVEVDNWEKKNETSTCPICKKLVPSQQVASLFHSFVNNYCTTHPEDYNELVKNINTEIEQLSKNDNIKNEKSEELVSATFYYFVANITNIFNIIFNSSIDEKDIEMNTVLFRDCVYIAFRMQLDIKEIPAFFEHTRKVLYNKNRKRIEYDYKDENTQKRLLEKNVFQNFQNHKNPK